MRVFSHWSISSRASRFRGGLGYCTEQPRPYLDSMQIQRRRFKNLTVSLPALNLNWLERTVLAIQFDAHNPVKMHLLLLEPLLYGLAILRLEFSQHLAFIQIHDHAPGAYFRPAVEPRRQFFSALARQARESMQRNKPSHRVLLFR